MLDALPLAELIGASHDRLRFPNGWATCPSGCEDLEKESTVKKKIRAPPRRNPVDRALVSRCSTREVSRGAGAAYERARFLDERINCDFNKTQIPGIRSVGWRALEGAYKL